jgi:hypothetical protein
VDELDPKFESPLYNAVIMKLPAEGRGAVQDAVVTLPTVLIGAAEHRVTGAPPLKT